MQSPFLQNKKEPRGEYRAAQAGGILESFRYYRSTAGPIL